MEALSGLYWNRDADDYVRIVSKKGQLQIDTGDDPLTLKAFDEGHFHVADRPWGDMVDVHFLPASSGQPRRIEQSFGGGKPDTFEAVDAFTPGPADLPQFAGAYVSEEIDPVYRLVLQDGTLKLSRLKHKTQTLRPAVRDVFTGDIGTVRFTRDANQRISGFILDAGRIRNFRFSRKPD